jgi:hypothetical protein
MQFEVELWDVINRYAITVGGDPAQHVYGNVPRMQAVADVGTIVARVASQEQIDDLVVEELAKGGSAAAAAACASKARVAELERHNAQLVADLNLAGPDSACCRARHRAEDERAKLSADVARLQAVLIDVRGFLRGVARRPELEHGAKDLIDEAEAIDRVLDGKEM